MKTLILSAAFAMLATTAMAGSIATPMVEPTMIIEQANTSSVDQNIIPPAFFLLSVAFALFLA